MYLNQYLETKNDPKHYLQLNQVANYIKHNKKLILVYILNDITLIIVTYTYMLFI